MTLINTTYSPRQEVPGFKLNRKGFEDLVFSLSSEQTLTRPDAAKFARDQGDGFVLPSMREEAAFRIAAQGSDRSRSDRNVEIYFQGEDGGFYRAVCDTPNAKENMILNPRRCEEIFNAHQKKNSYLVAIEDLMVAGALARARNLGRIVPVSDASPLELSTTAAEDGHSEFGQNADVRADLHDMAEPYAEYLRGENRPVGRVWLLTNQDLRNLGVTKERAEIRAGGFGDGYFVSINDLVVYDQFFNYGLTRGVRGAREISTGNQS